MINDHVSVSAPEIKLASVWLAAIGIASWSDLAAFLAAIYSAILIFEWLWKKLGRPFCEQRGWLKRVVRRGTDRTNDC